jgi:hypothetical protein
MRVEGWEAVLARAVEAARHRPFAWGQHDCTTWAFDVVGQLTGCELVDWRGHYHDQRSAMRYLRNQGARRLHEVGDFFLGKPRIAATFAQRGDLALVAPEHGFGICVGDHVAAPGNAGLSFVPLSAAVTAWEV